jgi:predicted RNase H-like nuclease
VRFLGIDLAWRESSADKLANQSGVVALDADGRISYAGWTVGVEETLEWLDRVAEDDALLFIDAPLVVNNPTGQRLCEKEVSQRYMHPWKVGANSTNLGSPRLAGVKLRRLLDERGWRYSDGVDGPETAGRVICECYPYTTIVGTDELDYDERPLYKRNAMKLKAAEWRPMRAAACDELIRRVSSLASADPSIELRSHPVTRSLIDEPSPLDNRAYKTREDLLDAALCAWTPALWSRWGKERCQVLGVDPGAEQPLATIIAPARPSQRRG